MVDVANARDVKTAGALLVLGAVQFGVVLLFSETLAPNYSSANNYVSELGIGPTALMFNASLAALGVMFLVAAYLIFKNSQAELNHAKLFSILFSLTAFAAIGTAMFPIAIEPQHAIFSHAIFFFAGLAILSSFKFLKKPLNYGALALGIFIAIVGLLYLTKNYLGFGVGGMERFVVYPALFGAFLLGGYFFFFHHLS